MPPGMILRSFAGFEGKATIPGLGAVAATFSRWTISRREERTLPGAEWTLHAVLSWSGPMLANQQLEKNFECVLSKEKVIKICGYESLEIVDGNLIVKGIEQCL